MLGVLFFFGEEISCLNILATLLNTLYTASMYSCFVKASLTVDCINRGPEWITCQGCASRNRPRLNYFDARCVLGFQAILASLGRVKAFFIKQLLK